MREIGSEFWDATPCGGETKYFLAGRTALDFIIRDILEENDIKRAILPSYCCESMIEPFIRNGIEVRFYDVYHDGNALCMSFPQPKDKEIFYAMKYFGFSELNGFEQKTIREKWEIIIEDRTHSWNAQSLFEDGYDYISYRKWTGLAGIASATKKSGRFVISQKNAVNAKYYSLRREAIKAKELYIKEKQKNKEIHLRMFHEAEEILKTDYVGYVPDGIMFQDFLNVDIKGLRQTRYKNAEKLMNGLKGVDGFRFVFKNLETGDVPLFMPILVPFGRDALQRYLTENGVYCPIHWPLSKLHGKFTGKAREMYLQELSIPCDQRYDKDDMERIIHIIKNFSEKTINNIL